MLTPTSIWGIVAMLGIIIAVLLVPTDGRKRRKAGRRTERSTPMKVTDPVCGMTFDKGKAAATVEHQGRTYYFCTEACRKQFEADPGRYAGTGA